jgi:hypothetical protein
VPYLSEQVCLDERQTQLQALVQHAYDAFILGLLATCADTLLVAVVNVVPWGGRHRSAVVAASRLRHRRGGRRRRALPVWNLNHGLQYGMQRVADHVRREAAVRQRRTQHVTGVRQVPRAELGHHGHQYGTRIVSYTLEAAPEKVGDALV